MSDKVTIQDIVVSLSSGKMAIVDGGLAKQCADELHKQFGSVDDTDLNKLLKTNENKPALESMQVDSVNEIGAWGAIASNVRDAEPALIYAVDGDTTSMSDSVRFDDAVTGMSDEQKANSALVVIKKKDVQNPWETNLYDVASAHGVTVYHSFESLTEALK